MAPLESVRVAHAMGTGKRSAEVIGLTFTQREAGSNLLNDAF
jgi:hypothetical protein